MDCPECGKNSVVMRGALCPGNKYIRRRKCRWCDCLFTTEEKISDDPLTTKMLNQVRDMRYK